MDENAIKEIFQNLKIKSSQQLLSGRYYVYKITTHKKSPLILKISKDKRTSLLLRNDYVWTQQVTQQIIQKNAYYIPKVFDSGFYKNTYYWMTAEYVEQSPFATVKDNIAYITVKNPKSYIRKVVALMLALQRVSIIGLRDVDNRFSPRKSSQKLMVLEEAIQRGSGIIPFYAELLQIIESNFRDLKPATTHGDLTPKNIMIDNHKRVVLADAELGSLHRYHYYDVAEFYMRLYTMCFRLDLAEYFFHVFKKNLQVRQQEGFMKQFLALLSLRCIANYSEIESLTQINKNKRLEYAGRLAENIASYQIIL